MKKNSVTLNTNGKSGGGGAKKWDAPEGVSEAESQRLIIIQSIAIQEVSNLDTGIISNIIKQNNLISEESYLIDCASINEENNDDIEKCNMSIIQKGGQLNAVYTRKSSLRMNFGSENQFFLSRNLFYVISTKAVWSDHSEKLE